VQLPAFELTSASEVSDLAFQLSATPYQAFQSGRHGFWIEGLGSHADGESTGTTAGYEINRYGVVAGYEHAIDATLLAGVIASMSTAKLALDGSAGDTDVNSYTIGAYGQNRLDQWRLTAAVNLGYGDYDSERNIQVGAVNAVARSNYDGLSYAATVGASRLYTEGRGKIEPYIRLTLEGAWTEKHDEDGAGEFDMVVDDDHLLLGTAELGVILAYEPDLDAPSGEFKLKPFIRQQIELEDSDVSVRFADASTSVAVDGRNQDLTEAGVVAEISVDLTDQAGFHLGGSASVDRYEVDYGGFVRLSFDW
jgi:outer membrane autotransporter protein